MYDGTCCCEHAPEKAAGTPMMSPSFWANSRARLTSIPIGQYRPVVVVRHVVLTLFPGEFSTSTGRSGTISPTRTNAVRVEWKPRLAVRAATVMGLRAWNGIGYILRR